MDSTKSIASKSHKAVSKSTTFKKYSKTTASTWIDPSSKLKPSDLSKPAVDIVADDYPMIIEFNNIRDNTFQIHSAVDMDQPLFQPSPKVVVFEDYAPFAVHEKKLFFRNNDSVARRIKIIQPDTPFFEISSPKLTSGENLRQSKVAAGMEICCIIKFKPQEVRDYSLDLICSTEREKFIVPIRALGMRPRLTFPDELHFGNCPIKTTNRKPFLVQNMGSSIAEFKLKSNNPVFTCSDELISIEPGGSQMLEVFFTPIISQIIVGELEVSFSKGLRCYISMSGGGSNVDVSLSTPSLALESSYITLSSQKTLKIKNTSNLPIHFTWKSFASQQEEEDERNRLLYEINRMEEIEAAQLRQKIADGFFIDDGNESDESNDGEGSHILIPFSARAEEAALIRKYRNLRTALQNDNMEFVDDIFEISPVQGYVWANSEIEIAATFRPDTAALFNCLAFLDVSGRHERLSLHLSGQGIGPHACLSFDVLDIGDVFVNKELQYELNIINKGDIPAQWNFMNSLTKFGNKFEFNPKEGNLNPGQSQKIDIRFESDVLGEFSEFFRFALQGNEVMLVCQIKGHVVGPTFHFDCQSIDFGSVSFDYLHSTNLRLVNTSMIPMIFNLHIPQDGSFMRREFNIEPSNGTLSPGEHCDVLLEFIPTTVKKYDYSLAVDVLGVGDMLLSIPITADCIVSSIRLDTKELEFGDCFARYPYEKVLRLTNVSDVVYTKFEFLPQPSYTNGTATYEVEPATAVIEPKESMFVTVRLVGVKLGQFKLPLQINVAGSQEPPIQASMTFNVIGPRVIVDSPELKWGNVECLKDTSRTLTITNDSLVTCSMKIFLKMSRSKYELSTRELVLGPHESHELIVTANLDDTVVCKDEIHIIVEEGGNLMIPISAKGIGTTMHCQNDLTKLDFGTQLTNMTFEKKIILENKGRRPQLLRWVNKTASEENEARAAKAKKLGKDMSSKLPKHLAPTVPIFSVTPDEITLRPRTATTFTFKGSFPTPGTISEVFSLESRIGKERAAKEIALTTLVCDLVDPLLEISHSELSFAYKWEVNVEPLIQRKIVTLRNASLIPLTFVLKTEVPFNLSSWEHSLPAGQSVDITVEFDPLYQDSKESHDIDKQLIISYRGHPQKDVISLKGSIDFPNLKFENMNIAFGCILNDTTKTIRVKATNCSRVPVNYEWVFIEQKISNKRGSVAALPLNQVFDILPSRSFLAPGESEDVEFTMLGNSNNKVNGNVICIVEGGPEYKFNLSGESSTVAFALDKSIIDFGKVMFVDKQDGELTISNTGRVNFNFTIAPATVDGSHVLEVIPSSGKVQAGQNLKIVVRVRPFMPNFICEDLSISVAHFDPVFVKCYCQAIFPCASVFLPRYKKIGPFGDEDGNLKEMWDGFQNEVIMNIVAPDESILPGKMEDYPPPAKGNSSAAPVYSDSVIVHSAQMMKEDGEESVFNSVASLGTSKGPPQASIEMEMHRLVLCELLKRKLKQVEAGELPLLESVDPSLPIPTSSLLQHSLARHVSLESLVVAHYYCDFGNVISGQTKKKVFKITNSSFIGPLNWSFDKTSFSGSGFTIEPEKVTKIPEQGTVDFVVKYFARTTQKLGKKTVIVPMLVKGSAQINLVLSANVCIPDLELSTELLDFEKVQIGRSKKMYVRLQNNSPVTAHLLLRRVPGKDESRIMFNPTDGSIKSGKKLIVEFEFMPAEARKYLLELQVRIDMNNKPKTLTIVGEGTNALLKFDPPHVDLGPVLPYSEGQESMVTIQNLSTLPVEFFSLDFDSHYREEELLLSKLLPIYNIDGYYRSAVRIPGEGLPAELNQMYAKYCEDNSASEEDLLSAYQPIQNEQIFIPRNDNLHQDILLLGPPLSGISTMANHLSKRLQLPVLTLDGIIAEMCSGNGREGKFARCLFGKMSENEQQEFEEEKGRLQKAAETSKAEATEAFTKQTKGKVKEIPANVLETPEVIEYNKFLQEWVLSAQSLAKLIHYRLSKSDCGYGVVIDSISTNRVDESMALEAVHLACPQLVVANLVLPDGKDGHSVRMGQMESDVMNDIDHLERSMESTKKSLLTRKKSPRGKPSGNTTTTTAIPAVTNVIDLENGVIPVALPNGDEPWIHPDTGVVMELDNQDFKALEEAQRSPYLRQLLYQQFCRKQEDLDILRRLHSIWSSTSGFLSDRVVENSQEMMVAEKAEDVSISNSNESHSSTTGKTLLYDEYQSKIVDRIHAVFDAPVPDVEAPPPSTEENPEQTSDIVESNPLQTFGVFDVVISGEDTHDDIFQSLLALLPPPKVAPPEKDTLPPPSNYQIIKKPVGRADRKLLKNFKIFLSGDNHDNQSTSESTETRVSYRWTVQPQESVQIRVHFSSLDEGKFDANLAFEVVGTQQVFSLFCGGQCEVPKVNSDSRNLFLKRARTWTPGSIPPMKRFVISDNFYCFGPLQVFKSSSWRSLANDSNPDNVAKYSLVRGTNMDILRLSNNGKYRCKIEIYLEDAMEESKGIFYVDPTVLEIDEGETKEVEIWAFPTAVKEYSNRVIACIADNPCPIICPVRAWGVEPTIEVTGPWSESIAEAEAAVSNCQDKKLLKDLESKLQSLKEFLTIDFQRFLVGKTESRSFDVKNTSMLPIAWELDMGDYKNNNNLIITPSSGVLPPLTNVTVVLSFTSSTPVMSTGKFSLRYSDAEGGLASTDRVGTKIFRVVAEAYFIKAVSLTATGQEEGGDVIDFGTLRVGDYAVQSLKVGNKGKYPIGFKFVFSKPTLSSLIKIEPEEGTIDTNGSVDIKLTFCCSQSELLLSLNRDIQVQISEPLTGELVEKFTLAISANAKYNRFRMQPSKGMQFGAVRFDSSVRTKRVELRNEGIFAFAYVVCPALSEYDEVEGLDGTAFSGLVYASPPGVRTQLLGEGYMEKVGKSDGKGAAKKDTKAPPPKGKGGANTGAAASNSLVPGNPLVMDPDGITPMTFPEEPLSLGPFTITPRMGLVEPGQCVGIDMTFDPSGCVASKERLRIIITGIDGKDSVLQATLRSFDVTGESCFPAITVNEPHSIFEEQEVVHTLSDALIASSSSSASPSESSARVEKLPVGKVVYSVTDKLLAFGPMLCNLGVTSKTCVEKIKIVNPTKVDTKVSFAVLSPEGAASWQSAQNSGKAAATSGAPPGKSGGGKDAKGKGGAAPAAAGTSTISTYAASSIFTCQPDSWEIPPHESRFVNIYFNPIEMKSYRAMFVAEVDYQGTETSVLPQNPSSGKILNFDLAGSGTLPCIAVEHPVERSSDGSVAISFGKVLVSRSVKKTIILRNDGVLPSTCLFEMKPDSNFNFPSRGSSLTIPPGGRQEVSLFFTPKDTALTSGTSSATCHCSIKLTVLQNPFDVYQFSCQGETYSCNAMIEPLQETSLVNEEVVNYEEIRFPDVNLLDLHNPTSVYSFSLKSRSSEYLKFKVDFPPELSDKIDVVPSCGHLSPLDARELKLTFHPTAPCKLQGNPFKITLSEITYPVDVPDVENLRGSWDDSMKSVRPVTEEDYKVIHDSEEAWKDYHSKVEAEKAKGKKAKPVGPPPPVCNLKIEKSSDGSDYICETIGEPNHEMKSGGLGEQAISLTCFAVADQAKFKCDHLGESIEMKPTFLFQTTVHKFRLSNESDVELPLKWNFDNLKKRTANTRGGGTSQASSRQTTGSRNLDPATIPCPFEIEPVQCRVPPHGTTEFMLKFCPLETDDFRYLLRAETTPATPIFSDAAAGSAQPGAEGPGPAHILLRGTSKRPLCHFDLIETPDYLNRRPSNLKNENGLFSPIEYSDLRVVEVESVGIKTRNTFRFHVINPTNQNFEFLWEFSGDPSPFWRCVQSAGMLFGGKRVEMVFEYLPEDTNVAEAFCKFRLPAAGVEQLFLFTGKIREPKVSFSSSKIDFHSVMLGGEGGSDTIYLENEEHLPFNFAFEKQSLMQLEGPSGDILEISPKFGTIPPHSRFPINFVFHPQEEVLYNFNLTCEIKRKPHKLTLNVKGEGYSVHPIIQIEQSEEQVALLNDPTGSRFQTLRPSPFVNYADFGIVQVLDTIPKAITVSNHGKYNFDYLWDVDSMNSMLTLSGGKYGGTLHKGEEISYTLTFAPQKEESIGGGSLSVTIAGKYTYVIMPRGVAVEPALRFSFHQHDFGPSFITSPGGTTVIEEAMLRLVNHDAVNNISVECVFQKTRVLWVDCPPTVLEPGTALEVPFRFAPREAIDYSFVVPFVINGTSKVLVEVSGRGIHPRLELVSQTQHRLNFGLVNVGSEVRKTVSLVNRSKKALGVQLLESGQYGGALEDHCVSFSPRSEFIVQPRETTDILVSFSPSHRVSQFTEDLMIRYAGITRKLLSVSGKAQGIEVSLDTDSLPFGTVVIDSQKMKHLTLENTGDLPVTFQWQESTFGKHFRIQPTSGKVLAGNEMTFEVFFRPQFLDEDIRQDRITLVIPGISPMLLTCTGSCIAQPQENIKTLEFSSLARKNEIKTIKIANPSDKDWYLTPSLHGAHWKVPHEFKIPAKGSGDLPVTFYPLSMCNNENPHVGKLFIALPDGSAILYEMKGVAGAPESSGVVTAETPAKKPTSVIVKLNNWLNETQKFRVSVEVLESPTPATSLIAANAVEVAAHGTKEFPVRFVSFTEGSTKGRITFTNTSTNEYCFYDFVGKTTMADILETITLDSPVRQTARYVVTLENPLPVGTEVAMGTASKPTEWWTCDSKYIRVNELMPFSGHAEGNFEIEYRPLVPTTQPMEHLLSIYSKELGVFKYKLKVTSSPPTLRQVLRFDVSLGSIQVEPFVFRAFNSTKADYSCVVSRNDLFNVPKTVAVDAVTQWEGNEARINIGFEPVAVGSFQDTLIVSHPEGGEYICELVANCSAPLPQGPFSVTQGKSGVDIPFRNPFPQQCAFSFSVDSPAFKVGSNSSNVPPKSEGKIAVTFDPQGDLLSTPSGIINAKLFVNCTTRPDAPSWVFYLKGKIDANASVSPVKSGKK